MAIWKRKNIELIVMENAVNNQKYMKKMMNFKTMNQKISTQITYQEHVHEVAKENEDYEELMMTITIQIIHQIIIKEHIIFILVFKPVEDQ
jgi:hypothetical protein